MESSPSTLLYSFDNRNLDQFIRNSIIPVFGQLQLLLRNNLQLLPYKFDPKSSFPPSSSRFLCIAYNWLICFFGILPKLTLCTGLQTTHFSQGKQSIFQPRKGTKSKQDGSFGQSTFVSSEVFLTCRFLSQLQMELFYISLFCLHVHSWILPC